MKKILSVFLAAVMLAAVLPLTVQAWETDAAPVGVVNPPDVRVTVNADYSVSVSWDATPNADHYVVDLCNKDEKSGNFYQITPSNSFTFAATAARSCKFDSQYLYRYGYGTMDYYVVVLVYNNANIRLTTGYSKVFQTGIPILSSPAPLSFESSGIASWQKVPNAERYDVRLYTQGGTYTAQAYTVSSSYDFSAKLTVGESYYFTVVAETPYSKSCRASETVKSGILTVAGPDTFNVHGRIISYLDPADTVTVRLIQPFSFQSYSTSFSGNDTNFTIPNVEKNTYVYSVKKKNHATKTDFISFDTLALMVFVIHPIGDINGDGKVTTVDFGKANSHARGKSKLTGYEFNCADVNEDSTVTTVDAGRINSHARGKSSLWE